MQPHAARTRRLGACAQRSRRCDQRRKAASNLTHACSHVCSRSASGSESKRGFARGYGWPRMCFCTVPAVLYTVICLLSRRCHVQLSRFSHNHPYQRPERGVPIWISAAGGSLEQLRRRDGGGDGVAVWRRSPGGQGGRCWRWVAAWGARVGCPAGFLVVLGVLLHVRQNYCEKCFFMGVMVCCVCIECAHGLFQTPVHTWVCVVCAFGTVPNRP